MPTTTARINDVSYYFSDVLERYYSEYPNDLANLRSYAMPPLNTDKLGRKSPTLSEKENYEIHAILIMIKNCLAPCFYRLKPIFFYKEYTKYQ